MIRTIGVYLLVAAVVVRGLVVFSGTPQFPIVAGSLGAYCVLLVLEPWFTHSKKPGLPRPSDPGSPPRQGWRPLLYIFLQTCLVVAAMSVPEPQDFISLLFVPLSLNVVLLFGGRTGMVFIAIFSAITILELLGAEDGPIFGTAMAVFFSCICFLFGGYAHQVQKAERARQQNQQMLNELQAAHDQLQHYTDQAASLAVEQERNRLARNLHDSVTQTVFSMNLAAQTARLLLEKDPQRSLGQLLHLEELAALALGEIQSVVSQYRPHSGGEQDLPSALRKMTEERQAREGLRVILKMDGEAPLSAAEVAGLTSIAHEALTNVIKHSGTRQAEIRLHLAADAPFLEIEDRGRGFDPQAKRDPAHLGIAGMSERAREIGWSLSVESQPGQGTSLRVARERSGGQR